MKKYQNCSICKTIPDRCYAYWKGGELRTDPLPASESKLEIIGAPFFKDHTSHTHSIVKLCPECGTFYKWDFEYEYLANGSEDDITLTRASEDEIKHNVRDMFKKIKLYESLFRRDALNIIKALRKSPKPGPKLLKDASDLFYFNQLKGFNISFAVKDLVQALEKHAHRAKNRCPAAFISFSLKDFAKKNVINKKKLFSILQNVKSKNAPPEINELIKFCK